MKATRHTRFSFLAFAALALIVSLTLVGCTGESGGDTTKTSSVTGSGHILDANTVALWRLNEASASSNAADETGGYELTQFGDPNIVSGPFNNGRLLDGSSKFFQRAGDVNLGTVFNGNWTYEGWVYLDPTFSVGGTLFIYNGLEFSITDTDTILAEVGVLSNRRIFWHQWHSTSSVTEISSNAVLQTGQFYHIAVSRTAQGGDLFTYRIYINGVLDRETADVSGLSYPVPGDSHYIGLGCYTSIDGFGVPGNVLNGRLDDTRISKIARSDAEILESYERRGPVFADNGDGTITDKRTGLMWLQSPYSSYILWQAAMDYCAALDFAGHTDWRAPTIDELEGLIQGWTGASPGAWLAEQGFNNVVADVTWSSTTCATDPACAWTVYMLDGSSGGRLKAFGSYTRPVRTGP